MRALYLHLITAILVLAFAPGAFAWKTKFSSKLCLSGTYYPVDLEQGTSQWSSPVRLEPEISFKKSKAFKITIAPYLYSDPSSSSPGEKAIVDFNEANVESKMGDFNLKVGFNSVSWGATDVFNPLDVVASRRYMDPLNGEKRGVPSVILGYDGGASRFEAIYVPVQQDAFLPGENSRWLPRDITVNRSNDFAQVDLPKDLHYSYLPKEEIENAQRDGFGARYEHSGEGMDFSAIFYQGAATTPAIFPEISGTITSLDPLLIQLDPEVKLRPVYYKRRTAGASAVMTLESTIFRIAGAASEQLHARSNLPGSAQYGVLGVEHNLAVGASTLTVLLQGTIAAHEDQADNQVSSLERIFDRSWLLGFRLATSSEWTVTLAALYDTVWEGLFTQFKAERKITDGLTATIGADIVEGKPGTPLGTYRKNDRVTFGLTLFF